MSFVIIKKGKIFETRQTFENVFYDNKTSSD